MKTQQLKLVRPTKQSGAENIKVIVRCRPFIEREKNNNEHLEECVAIEKESRQVSLYRPGITVQGQLKEKGNYKTFRYDDVFGPDSEQQAVYAEAAFAVVEEAFNGYNGTVFAYGQTGSGKTHTMVGLQHQKGIMPNVFDHVFDIVNTTTKGKPEGVQQVLIRCQFIEIYNEEIRDLLTTDVIKKRLEIKECPNAGVKVQEAEMRICNSVHELVKALAEGNKNKVTGETRMNHDSSRSHCIFTIFVETAVKNNNSGIGEANQKQIIRMGKLNLVDLAGSEKQKKTGSSGIRFREATKINLSLSALMNVITSLVDGKSTHVPYRDSKLTRLLQDSLGGNVKTCMIANISPAQSSYEETLSTLRYADRAKRIKNQPKVNEDPKDTLLRQYAEQIQLLKEQLVMIKEQHEQSKQQFSLQHQQSANASHLSPSMGKGKSHRSFKGASQASPKSSRIARKKNNSHIGSAKSSASHQVADSPTQKRSTMKSSLNDDELNFSQSGFLTELSQDDGNKQPVKSQRSVKHGGLKPVLDFVEEEQQVIQIALEKEQRSKLELQLAELQAKLASSNSNMQEIEENELEKIRQYRQMQLEIQEQREREKSLIEEKERKEEEVLLVETNYQNLQEEVDGMRRLIKNFRIRYKQAVNEIQDLNEEHAREQADMFETIQNYEKEVNLYKTILRGILDMKELQKLEQKCTYDSDNKKWKVPLFTVGSKQVTFPKLKLNQSLAIIDSNAAVVPQFKLRHQDGQGQDNEVRVLDYRANSVSKKNNDAGTWREMSAGRRSLADFASMSFRGDSGTETKELDSPSRNMRSTLYAEASREALSLNMVHTQVKNTAAKNNILSHSLSRSQDNFFKKQSSTNQTGGVNNTVKLKPLMLRKPNFNKHLQGTYTSAQQQNLTPQHVSQTMNPTQKQNFTMEKDIEKENLKSAKPSRLFLSQLVNNNKNKTKQETPLILEVQSVKAKSKTKDNVLYSFQKGGDQQQTNFAKAFKPSQVLHEMAEEEFYPTHSNLSEQQEQKELEQDSQSPNKQIEMKLDQEHNIIQFSKQNEEEASYIVRNQQIADLESHSTSQQLESQQSELTNKEVLSPSLNSGKETKETEVKHKNQRPPTAIESSSVDYQSIPNNSVTQQFTASGRPASQSSLVQSIKAKMKTRAAAKRNQSQFNSTGELLATKSASEIKIPEGIQQRIRQKRLTAKIVRRNVPVPGKFKEMNIKDIQEKESNGKIYYEDKSTTVIQHFSIAPNKTQQ